MSDRIAMNLPVPHIDIDGSVSDLRLIRYASREWMVLQGSGPDSSIVVRDATHARAIAHALTVAANLLDGNPEV